MDKTTQPKEEKTPKVAATVEIVCVDCGKSRTIPKGEAFQVKRCEECQAKHRKTLRKSYRKNRIQALRERITGLEAFIKGAGLEIPTT